MRAMFVTSTSTTWVSWAEVCSDSSIRSEMILRSRETFSVVPRSGEGVMDAAAGWVEAAAAGAAPPAAGALADSAAASTSCLRIRPPTPVPLTLARSTPCWVASLRTSGVT